MCCVFFVAALRNCLLVNFILIFGVLTYFFCDNFENYQRMKAFCIYFGVSILKINKYHFGRALLPGER